MVAKKVSKEKTSQKLAPPLARPAYILFLDIKGFSDLGEDQQNKLVIEFFNEAAKLLNKSQGKILDQKTIGDCIIVYFSDERECVKIAVLLSALLKGDHFWKTNDLPEKLACRIALHMGAITLLHDPIEKKKAAFGRCISTAARLEPIVRPNEIWCTEAFHRSVSEMNNLDSKYKFEPIGRAELAKGWGNAAVYALHDDDIRPAQLINELPGSSISYPDPKFGFTYFIFIRLRHKHSGDAHVLKLFRELKVTIDGVYYIFGDHDILLKIKSTTLLDYPLIHKSLSKDKIIASGVEDLNADDVILFGIKGVIDTSVEYNMINSANAGAYKYVELTNRNEYFRAFIYLSSVKIAQASDTTIGFKDLIAAIKVGSEFCNLYVNGTSLIIEVIFKTSAYYELSNMVEKMEKYCHRVNWDIAKSITFPVHDWEKDA